MTKCIIIDCKKTAKKIIKLGELKNHYCKPHYKKIWFQLTRGHRQVSFV